MIINFCLHERSFLFQNYVKQLTDMLTTIAQI